MARALSGRMVACVYYKSAARAAVNVDDNARTSFSVWFKDWVLVGFCCGSMTIGTGLAHCIALLASQLSVTEQVCNASKPLSTRRTPYI